MEITFINAYNTGHAQAANRAAHTPAQHGERSAQPKPPRVSIPLKGPKHEIFESGFFTEIRPVRIGDLGTGEKK
jgi:hypothetical protein